MTWHLILAGLTGGILIAHGIDIAFIHRDPPPTARIATRQSRRVAGIVVILIALANIAVNFLSFPE
ncbi:hypothetical protein [Sphingomonas koreensis]